MILRFGSILLKYLHICRTAVLLSILLLPLLGHTLELFVVKDIQVEGLQRISIGTVFNYLPVKVGDRLTKKGARQAVRALFKTGFFKDVKLHQRGNTLIVIVVERPSIASIDITGSKKITLDDLKQKLREAGLAEGRTFNRSLLEQIEQELERHYFSLGHYAVKVDPSVKKLERNRVALTIDISEGRVARIQEITIVGNRLFSDKELLGNFKLRRTADNMIFSKRDRYSKQGLEGDLEKLRNFYQDTGYLDFSINSTQVSITPDKEFIYITINVTEGRRYTVSNVQLSGNTILPREEIWKLITIKKGDVFSRREVTEITNYITERLWEEGYAFAKVNAIPKTDREKTTVAFNFFINPGKRVYIRRINIFGNTVTKDEVIRRELRQLEGSWFSNSKLRKSKIRLQRLGYFQGIDIKTPPVAGTTDQVDVNITVKEQSTGSIMFGAGYSDANGVFANVSYNERNAFGTGKEVVVSFDNSQATTVFEIRYNNPYYTLGGINRGFELYSRSVNAEQTSTGQYSSTTNGAGVFYGFPIGEDRKLHAGLAVEGVRVDADSDSAQVAQDFNTAYPSGANILKTTLGWSQDTLNSFIFPTSGGLYRVQVEAGVPGADLQYYKGTLDASYYIPFGAKSTFRVKASLGYGTGYSGTGGLPFFKNFYAGGSSSVRGFRARSLGPKDSDDPWYGPTNDPIGGNQLVIGNAEYFFPLPGGSKEDNSMRLSLFLDAGMVYASGADVDLGLLRYSAGIAFNWFTPMFPIALSLAAPLNAQTGDSIEAFQFSIGLPLR